MQKSFWWWQCSDRYISLSTVYHYLKQSRPASKHPESYSKINPTKGKKAPWILDIMTPRWMEVTEEEKSGRKPLRKKKVDRSPWGREKWAEAPEAEKSGRKPLRKTKEWTEAPEEEKNGWKPLKKRKVDRSHWGWEKNGRKSLRKRKKWTEAPEEEGKKWMEAPEDEKGVAWGRLGLLPTLCCWAFWMVVICWATTDNTSMSMRLNSSKHAQAPELKINRQVPVNMQNTLWWRVW